jgi:hypothetical protein
MLLKNEVKIGEIYGWDVECMTGSIHKPTKTVKIMEVDSLLVVECQQTGQLFSCGTHMLTTAERIKKMYEGYKNTIINNSESEMELYSYNKTLKRLEDILFQLDLNNINDLCKQLK